MKFAYLIAGLRMFWRPRRVFAFAVLAMVVLVRVTSGVVIDATWDVNGNGNWNTAGNWDIGVIPNNNMTNQYNVRIDNDTNFNVVVSLNANRTINNLTVDAGDTLRLPGGLIQNFDLTIAGSSITNYGTILLDAAQGESDLIISASATTLSGSGTLTLGAPYSNRVVGSVATNELVNGSTHTIAGGGLLGDNILKLNNQGAIDANVSGEVLIVDPSSSGAVNTGTMRARNGGTMRLERGAFTNAGAFILALTGSTVRLGTNAVIDGGTLASEGTGSIQIDGNGVTLKDVTLDAGSLLQILDTRNPILQGTITNNGTIEQNSTGSATTASISGSVTLAGSGEWKMSNNAANTIGVSGSGALINGPLHTIRGAGTIGTFGMDVSNQGTVIADQSTPLRLELLSSAIITNSGTLRAENGATLQVHHALNSTGGLIEADDGSTVLFDFGASQFIGDTFSTSGSGVIQIDFTENNVMADVTINGLLRLSNDVDTLLGGTITNNGTVEQNSTGAVTATQFGANLTLTGSGVWKMSNDVNNQIQAFANNPLLTNDTNHTIQGAGTLGANTMGLDNKGLIDANQSTALIVDPSSTGATNSGAMQASNGGTLRLNAATYTNTGGTILAKDASTVELGASSTFVGGSLTTEGSGVIKSDTAVFQNVTLTGGSRLEILDSASPILQGTTLTNNGTVEQLTTSGTTLVRVNANVMLTGSGVWKMLNNNDRFGGSGATLTNDTGHTIQGGGMLGNNQLGLVNAGLIDANETVALTIDPALGAATVVNQSSGILRGTSAAGLQLTGGTFDNQGTVEALNGSNATYSTTATTSNNVAGVLTGGNWRSVATGDGATITLRGSNITQIAAGTEIVLSGAGSVLQVVTTPIDSTLTTNNGTLRILNSRNYTAVPVTAFANNGDLEIGGGGFGSTSLTNSASGEIFGFGGIVPRPINSGIIRAAGGTLGFSSGIQGGSGTVQIDPGARLDVSSGASDSSADLLVHNSELPNGLNLGSHHFVVGVDYQNASFGVGNAFNARANVVGTGQIRATTGVAQTLTGSGITNGGTMSATLSLGNVHLGDFTTLNYRINNAASSGTNLRGAIQTTGFGANISDSRLSGAGVTASNFGPIAVAAESGDLAVTFDGTSIGQLIAQRVRIVNNFDNVVDQLLTFTGAVYRLAAASDHAPEPIDFGIVHVGDVLGQALAITNTATNDGFSERLDASFGSPTGDATSSGFFLGLAPGATDSTSLMVGVDTVTAGVKSGTTTIMLQSTGLGTSGLGNTALMAQTVNVQAQVNNFAVADLVKLSGDGALSMTGANEYTLDFGLIDEGQAALMAELGVVNDALAPADDLAGSFTLDAADFSLSGFSPFAGLATGSTQSGLLAELDSSTVGTFSGQITLQPQSTNPRPFSMNLAPITIHLVGEVRLPGDFNHDGTVDAADYVAWRNNDGTQAGYNAWRANFGESGGSGSGAGANAAIPEPATLVMLIVAAAGVSTRRRWGKFRVS